jgi:hypothetical protein
MRSHAGGSAHGRRRRQRRDGRGRWLRGPPQRRGGQAGRWRRRGGRLEAHHGGLVRTRHGPRRRPLRRAYRRSIERGRRRGPHVHQRRDGSRRRWLRRGCGRRGDHRRPHVGRTAVHERRQRGHQVGELVQLGLRHLARLAAGQLQRCGPLLQRSGQHVHAEHLRRRVERLQPSAQLVARPRRLGAPNEESERATQLTRLLGEAVYEALACKPERSVMGSLRHGEAECTQLADRGQFPHIRAPPRPPGGPSRAPLRRRLTPPHLPPRFRLLRGCNSVGRVPASHAGCRGFESHRPLR